MPCQHLALDYPQFHTRIFEKKILWGAKVGKKVKAALAVY